MTLFQLFSQQNVDEVMKVVEHWFNLLGKSPVSLVLNILKQPFKDLRLGALNVFFQLSSQPWAQKLMNDQAGNGVLQIAL